MKRSIAEGGSTMTNGDVKITLFPSPPEYRAADAQEEQQIVEVVRTNVLPREKAEYHAVRVKVVRKEDGSPDYVVSYMLRKDTYTADVVRADLDENFEVTRYVDDYLDEDDEGEEGDEAESYAGEEIEFVAATCVPEIPTAKKAVEYIHELATKAGFKSKVLLGADASVANYKYYLRSGLKGFVNVGHGYPGGIILSDGTLSSSWFGAIAGRLLCPTVLYLNSCQVHNAPLKPAIMAAGARTYIGGIVNLLIGPSEEVCKCFWKKVLAQGADMGPSLTSCESANYPSRGAHGIAGYEGKLNFVSATIDNYKVVLYGKDALAGDLVAFIHCYSTGRNVVTCEFYRDGSSLPENRYKGCRVGLVYPWSRFSAVLDVLRNEKPVYFGFILSTKVGYVSTRSEPVGEGEA
jgi:hypothetical protein